MKLNEGKPGNVTLIGLAAFALLIFAVAEKTAAPERQPFYDKKLQAAKTALLAAQAIKEYSRVLGIPIDVQNDPYHTGLIGQERTPITSDRGMVNAKILATNPNYAAVFVDMLLKAKLKKGSVVAAGMTGSLPGWNIAFLAACDALELTPIIISSVGASDWGANLPSLTWLDMERVLNERGIFQLKSVAASIGGPSDNGRGLSPEGRDLIKAAVERNHVKFIDEPTLQASISKRMEMYAAAADGKPIACYVNIGGGSASIGGAANARLIPPGLTQHLAVKNFPTRGIINLFAEQGLPVINLLELEKIALKYNLPIEVTEKAPELGEGSLFFKDRYSVSSTIILTVILGVVVFAVIRIDVKHYLFKRKSIPLSQTEA
ncbi:MAG TPA: poly-gamma-glutamate system protein [Bacteroidota bacterium]|nr:poly-gamma-glutamate system protein [Bacteroidota bacterium]